MLASPSASAGRRPFLFLYDSEIIPEGEVELEQWLWAESRAPSHLQSPAYYWIWWGPVVGLSNHLELAIPFEVLASRAGTWLYDFSADLRYRLFPREKDDGLQPLLRVAYNQAIDRRARPSSFQFNVVMAYGRSNQLHLSADFGMRFGLPMAGVSAKPITASYAAGAAYPLPGGEFRVSVEIRGEHGLQDTSSTDYYPGYYAGGAISWTRGRIWITAGTLVGITSLSDSSAYFLPRLIWAVAL